MKPELKLCAFCGGEAAFNSHKTTNKEIIKLNKRNVGYGVNCVECATNNIGLILGYASKEEAAQAWNRRGPAEPVKVPSDDDLEEFMGRFVGYSGFIQDDAFVDCARALIAKYGKHRVAPTSDKPASDSQNATHAPQNALLHIQIMTLRKYQAWRKGEDERTMDEAGIVPSAITSALDAILDYASSITTNHQTRETNGN